MISYVSGIAIFKGYNKTIQISNTLFGLIAGSILLSVVNYFFPTQYSFSAKFIASLTLTISATILCSRLILNYFNKVKIKRSTVRTLAIVGNNSFIEYLRKIKIKNSTFSNLLNIKPNNDITKDDIDNYIGKQNQLPDLAEIYNVNEVVFSAEDISYKDIINQMDKTKNEFIDFKITLNNNIIIGGKNIEKIA